MVALVLDRGRGAVLARRQEVEREVLEFFREALAPGRGAKSPERVVHAREFESVVAAAGHAQRRAAVAEELAKSRGAMLERVERSLSWRLTAPLRAMQRARLARRVARSR